jgi:hypothetical protein
VQEWTLLLRWIEMTSPRGPDSAMISRTHSATAVLLMVLLVTVVGCREVRTSARLQSGPKFLLVGSGKLASFRIYGPQTGRKIATPFDPKSLTWYVQPSDGYFKGSEVQRLVVEYGKIPAGYTQTVPNAGAAPELTSHMVYYFFAETTDAPPAEGFFYLDGDVPTEIVVPGLCQSAFVGDVKPLKCGTKDPYVEPTNLEQFVRENRVQR